MAAVRGAFAQVAFSPKTSEHTNQTRARIRDMHKDTAQNENVLVQTWLDSLKVALLEKDDQKAYELTQNLPQNLQTQDLEMKLQARELISQVLELLQERKQHAKHSMQQIKAARAFLEN